MTPRQAAQRLRRAPALARRAAQKAEQQSAKEAKIEAVKSSSGPLTYAALRRMGHPYAKRHGKALVNPEIINAQSRRKKGGRVPFRASWRVESTANGAQLINDSDVAKRMKGTRYMVPRPIKRRIIRRTKRDRRLRLKTLVRKALL